MEVYLFIYNSMIYLNLYITLLLSIKIWGKL